MATSIQNLNEVLDLSESVQVPCYDPTSGNNRRFSLTTLIALLQESLTVLTTFLSSYAAPSATGQTVALSPATVGANNFMFITPAAGYAAMTLKWPLITECVHGQEVLVTITQSVTTVTHDLNGATSSYGLPTTFAANAKFRAKFDGVFKAWICVG